MNVHIDPTFAKLIPPLSDDERAKLEASIVEARGCRDPLVTWEGLLIDGHNRYEIATRLKLPYQVTAVRLPDRLAATIWIRWNQLGRRNLSDDQRAIQVAGLIDDLARQSKRQRASTAGKRGGRGRLKTNSLGDAASTKLFDKARIRPKISKRARVSERKVKQAQTIRKRAPELVGRIDAGDITLADAMRTIKPAVRAERLAAAVWPNGQYGVILADPPWKPDDGVLDPARRIENQYPTLTLDDLIAHRPQIDALAADDCVLLLWTTAQKVAEAIALVAGWGFAVKSGAVWVKDSIGMGYWFRSRHELLLLATRGTPMTPLEGHRPDSVITAPRRGHSEKPDAAYDLIERMFPMIPKVEIYARATRAGWARATNETSLRSA